jgi:hypothetical protein
MAQAWLPQKAADKVRRLEAISTPSNELLVASEIANKINTGKA